MKRLKLYLRLIRAIFAYSSHQKVRVSKMKYMISYNSSVSVIVCEIASQFPSCALLSETRGLHCAPS